MNEGVEEVGFWKRNDDDNDRRPDPKDLVDTEFYRSNPGLKEIIVEYLCLGYLESYEFGYSSCRFDCGVTGLEMGCCSQTDGQFVWPEGLFHYIIKHNVKIPENFLNHIMKMDCKRRGSMKTDSVQLWDSIQKKPVPISSDLLEWLCKHSTLTMSSHFKFSCVTLSSLEKECENNEEEEKDDSIVSLLSCVLL
mmetsp:Transcript_1152/g.1622  ORF Transcript_1152/g.1622 Transcript_1152/m.1622 type:complete len:193 (+) Transcript_1152:251-829(+)